MFQLATAGSYVIQNDKAVKELKSKEVIEFLDNEEEDNKEKEISISKTKNKVRIEEYKKLRDVLNQIIEKNKEEVIDNSIQKTKKL